MCVFTNVIFINLFTYWRVTVTAKLFPHILSLVIAVKRGSVPAALSLLKLWSGGSHGRQTIPPNRGSTAELAQQGEGGGGGGVMQGPSIARNLFNSIKIPVSYVLLFSMNFCVYVMDIWQKKSDYYCNIMEVHRIKESKFKTSSMEFYSFFFSLLSFSGSQLQCFTIIFPRYANCPATKNTETKWVSLKYPAVRHFVAKEHEISLRSW